MGNKNPVPLSSFPVTPEPTFDLGKFPVNVPVPLTENLGLPSILNTRQAETPVVSIGTKHESVRVADTLRKNKLTVPRYVYCL